MEFSVEKKKELATANEITNSYISYASSSNNVRKQNKHQKRSTKSARSTSSRPHTSHHVHSRDLYISKKYDLEHDDNDDKVVTNTITSSSRGKSASNSISQMLKLKAPTVYATKARSLHGSTLNVDDIPEIREAIQSYQELSERRRRRLEAANTKLWFEWLYGGGGGGGGGGGEEKKRISHQHYGRSSFYSAMQAYMPGGGAIVVAGKKCRKINDWV
jgi:hypothetical protein